MHLSSSDLLPLLFDEIIYLYKGKDLSPTHRKSILEAVFEGIRISIRAKKKKNSFEHEKSYFDKTTFIDTADRFCSEKLSRVDIVNKIQLRSGMDRKMANLSLLLIETRMDINLASQNNIIIKNFDNFIYHFSWNDKNSSHSENILWYEEILTQAIFNFKVKKKPSFWNLFSNRCNDLKKFVEAFELSALFRKPLSYEIKLEREKKVAKDSKIKEINEKKSKDIVWAKPFDHDELLPLPEMPDKKYD